jgi:tetratricopeptide (TPR) repeat protein
MALTDQQIDALARDAIQHATRGDFAAAEGLFARLVAERPNSGQGLHLLGQARLKLGRFAEAREPLERAAKFLPRDVGAQVNFAGCLSVLGEHAAALEALDRAARLKPGDPVIAHNRGRALEALGRLDEAEQAFSEALAADHRLMPSLSARASLLARRGDWMGALADLDMALTSQPDNAALKLRRAELLLGQGDWLRGLPDYEARLELPGLHAPGLPRWQGESLSGKLLVYPEQADIQSDAALRDTLLLARGLDAGVQAVVQCAPILAPHLGLPTIGRGQSLEGFAAALPLRSLPFVQGWSLPSLPAPPAPPVQRPDAPQADDNRVGWFSTAEPPPGLRIERDPAMIGHCARVVGDDNWPTCLAARLGIETELRLPAGADWLWGPDRGRSPWFATLTVVAHG